VKIYFDVLKNSERLKKAVCVLFALSAVLFYFLVILFHISLLELLLLYLIYFGIFDLFLKKIYNV